MRLRPLAVAALTVVGAFPALAADYPVLRGTSSPTLPPAPMIHEEPNAWDGFYIGGLAGYSSVTFNPGNSAADLIGAGPLMRSTYYEGQGASRNLQIPGFASRGTGFGAFGGYNIQSGEAVIGVEVDYMRIGRSGSAVGTDIGRRFINDGGSQRANVTLSGSSSARLDDLMTLRLRTGYVMGSVMPYITGGLAIGYGQTSTVARADVRLQDSIGGNNTGIWSPEAMAVGSPETLTNARRNAFMFGFSGGAGVEAMLGGLILRGEYLFSRVQAQGGTIIDVNQGRVGAGVKF